VAPPSNHLSGNCYRWDNQGTPSPVPEWLLNLWPKQNSGTTQQRAPAILGPVQDGYRNKTLTSWAGSMRARGMSEAAILAALRVENETRCVPPLPDGVVQVIAQGMNRYELGAPAPINPNNKPNKSKKGSHRKIYLPTVRVRL
jgi:putative DNA primase/helicase